MRSETNATSTKSRREELVKRFKESGSTASDFARAHGVKLTVQMAADRFEIEVSKIRSWVKTAVQCHVPIRMRICGKVGE